MNHWPTHVEVNVANIRHNVQQIRGRVRYIDEEID